MDVVHPMPRERLRRFIMESVHKNNTQCVTDMDVVHPGARERLRRFNMGSILTNFCPSIG